MRQSNTLLFVVLACVVAVVGTVVAVHALSPQEEKKPNALSGLRLTGPQGDFSAAPGDMQAPEQGRVQMLPIKVGEKQGLLVRYQADMIFDPIQQGIAENIVGKVKGEAEKAGVEVIVVMAVGPTGDAGLTMGDVHVLGFRRLVDGSWVPMHESELGLDDELGKLDPVGVGSAAPASSVVPLFVPH